MGGPFYLGTGNSCSLGEIPVNSGGYTSGTNGAGEMGRENASVSWGWSEVWLALVGWVQQGGTVSLGVRRTCLAVFWMMMILAKPALIYIWGGLSTTLGNAIDGKGSFQF